MATRDPDDLVAGRYRLDESDGGDGVVRVWTAHDTLLDRAVMAKEVTGRRQQGLDEARLLARFNRVLDVVEEPGRVWIITNLGETPPHAIGVARVRPAGPPAAGVRRRRPRALIVATATLAVAAAGGGIALAATHGGGDTPVAAPSAAAKGPAGNSPAGNSTAGNSTAGNSTAGNSTAGSSPATNGVPGNGAAAGGTATNGTAANGAAANGAATNGTAGTSPAPTSVATPKNQATFTVCGAGLPQGEMRGSTTDRVLPSGFVWHRDAHGFGFGVPDRWLRSRDKGTYCFRDPAGGRGFTVTGLASAVPDKAAYWRGLERTAQKDLPGYHRVSLAAAGWEYTWKPSDGVVRHSRQVLLTPGAGSAYVLNWTSADAQWTADQPIVQEAVSSFALDPSPAS